MRWFLAGLGVGTVVGMVVAPKSGAETREELADATSNRISGAKEKVESYAQAARKKIEPAIHHVRQHAEPLIGKVRARNGSEESATGVRQFANRGLLEILNEWPHERLIEIDGIGPILATKIIQSRPYQSEDDLLNSKALPPSAIENLRKVS